MWTYEQATGAIHWPNGNILCHGYSGAPGYINDPECQNLHAKGPIPQGLYTVGPPFNHTEHGPECLRLTPDPSNEMFGRDGFLIHGDKIGAPGTASEGCIILPRFARDRMADSDDKQLQVVSGMVTQLPAIDLDEHISG